MSTPRGEMMFFGPGSAFQLKLIPLNPFEFTGSGVEIRDSSSIIKRVKMTPEFGYRPLTHTDIEGLVNSLNNPEAMQSQLRRIIGRDPMTPAQLEKESLASILSGPVLTRPDLDALGPDVARLQNTLDKSAQKEFRERYPRRAGMFF
ncbi:MAG: hypothetical protein ACFE7R_04850 [Candidatus Hodarchaeota archaeon]